MIKSKFKLYFFELLNNWVKGYIETFCTKIFFFCFILLKSVVKKTEVCWVFNTIKMYSTSGHLKQCIELIFKMCLTKFEGYASNEYLVF